MKTNAVPLKTYRIIASQRLLFLCCALLLGSLLIGCRTQRAARGVRYDLKGKVVSVDKKNRQATIAHDDVKDYMPGMTMPFTLKDESALNLLASGDQISATLVVDADSASSWLEDVIIVKESTEASGVDKTVGIAEPKPNDDVPDFALVNQDGKRIHIKQYNGKALLLTFIYTRCPVPEYCTLMSNNFAEIDKELQKQPELYNRTHLLSISFDPDYDTPKVMRSYGAAHTENYDKETFAHWEFATGSKDEVKGIAQFFGLRYFQDTDQIVHSLRTAVIAPDGKLFKLYRGNEWKPAEALRDIQSVLDKNR